MDDLDSGNASRFEAQGERVRQFLGSQGHNSWPPLDALLKCSFEIAPGGERGYAEAVGILSDDTESALADGAGRTENGDLLQCLKSMNSGVLWLFRMTAELTKRTTVPGLRSGARRCGPELRRDRAATSLSPSLPPRV